MEQEGRFEILDSNARYLLGQDDEGFGIWRMQEEGDDPVARFAATDEGEQQAWDAFNRLSRPSIENRLIDPLIVALLTGLVGWFVTGAIGGFATMLNSDRYYSDPFIGTQGPAGWVHSVNFVGGLSFRLAICSLAALAGLWLTRQLRAAP